ncbi:hypothetical protein C5C53_05140 [Rathayibacter sp. AY1E3]|nr:hypothetical protein C5C53_05140 [Rathayibacter sp. AY1E3]
MVRRQTDDRADPRSRENAAEMRRVSGTYRSPTLLPDVDDFLRHAASRTRGPDAHPATFTGQTSSGGGRSRISPPWSPASGRPPPSDPPGALRGAPPSADHTTATRSGPARTRPSAAGALPMTAQIIDATDLDELRRVGQELREGATVIAQTDTNYGVFASPFSRSACFRLYDMKKRDGAKPLTLFVSAPRDWATWAFAPETADMDALVAAFWPGPLNVILRRKPVVPDWVTSGQDTVSVVHNLSAPINLLSIFAGLPLAATSANISGTVSTGLVDFDLAAEHLGGDSDYLIRSTTAPDSTMSSTIVSLVGGASIVRQGDVGADALRVVVPSLV